jgi:hypothetical protein
VLASSSTRACSASSASWRERSTRGPVRTTRV